MRVMAKSLPDEIAERLRGVTNQLTSSRWPVKINDVVEAAGIPRSTLYYYFEGSAGLTRFFVDDLLRQIGCRVNAAVSGQVTPPEQLQAAVDAVLSFAVEKPVLAWMLIRAVFISEDLERQIWQTQETVVGSLRSVLERGIAEGYFIAVDVGEAMASLFGSTALVCLYALDKGGPPNRPAMSRVVTTMSLRGLCTDRYRPMLPT